MRQTLVFNSSLLFFCNLIVDPAFLVRIREQWHYSQVITSGPPLREAPRAVVDLTDDLVSTSVSPPCCSTTQILSAGFHQLPPIPAALSFVSLCKAVTTVPGGTFLYLLDYLDRRLTNLRLLRSLLRHVVTGHAVKNVGGI